MFHFGCEGPQVPNDMKICGYKGSDVEKIAKELFCDFCDETTEEGSDVIAADGTWKDGFCFEIDSEKNEAKLIGCDIVKANKSGVIRKKSGWFKLDDKSPLESVASPFAGDGVERRPFLLALLPEVHADGRVHLFVEVGAFEESTVLIIDMLHNRLKFHSLRLVLQQLHNLVVV